jgi:hypothetical protein
MMQPMNTNPLTLTSNLRFCRNLFRPPVLPIGYFRCHPPIFKSLQQMRHLVFGLVALAMTGSAQAIQLTILMPDGSPATKARVEWRTLEFTPNEESGKLVVTPLDVNSKGEVILIDVEARSSYWNQLLVIDAPGAALAMHNFFKSSESVKLVPAFEVNGRMVTNEMEAVADGNVSVTAFGINCYVRISQSALWEGIPGFQAKTDEKGRFKLRGATYNGHESDSGAHLLGEAKVAGKKSVGSENASYLGNSLVLEKSGREPSATTEDLVELVVYPVGRVSGTILDGLTGKPREGARIRLMWPYGGYHGNPTATADKDGSFSFEDVPSYHQRCFQILWEKTHQVHPPVLSSPEKGPQVADVSGLRISTYDGKLCKGSVVDAISGKTPIIPLDLGYLQESDCGQGWTVRTSGEWGNIGMDARTGKNGSFSMWLPTGPFSFTATAGGIYQNPYGHKQEMDLKPGDHSHLRIKVPRK